MTNSNHMLSLSLEPFFLFILPFLFFKLTRLKNSGFAQAQQAGPSWIFFSASSGTQVRFPPCVQSTGKSPGWFLILNPVQIWHIWSTCFLLLSTKQAETRDSNPIWQRPQVSINPEVWWPAALSHHFRLRWFASSVKLIIISNRSTCKHRL